MDDIVKRTKTNVAPIHVKMEVFVLMLSTVIDVHAQSVSSERIVKRTWMIVQDFPIPVLMEVPAVTLLLPSFAIVHQDIPDIDVRLAETFALITHVKTVEGASIDQAFTKDIIANAKPVLGVKGARKTLMSAIITLA